MHKQSRFRSPVMWAAVVSQGLALLLTLGVVDTGWTQAVEQIAACVLQILAVVGVLNNPTDGAAF